MIYLLGIKHDIQLGLRPLLADRFVELVKEIITRIPIELVCEEVSIDVLKGVGIKTSPLEELCKTLKVRYKACDPTDKERLAKKILSPEEKLNIMQKLFESFKANIINRKPATEYQELRKILAKDDRKREKFWFSKIKGEKSKNILFICGTGHISSYRSSQGKGFDKMLKQNKWKAKTLAILTEDNLSS